MCSAPVDPGGEVCGCSVGCMLGMSAVSRFVFIAASYMGYLEQKKNALSSGGVLGAAEFSGVLIGMKSLFCFRSI